MALKHIQQTGRAAFTLVELLVVVGLLAIFATISVAGYSAASRGMADRGVIQNTVATLRIAQQVCEIDRVPTKVLFFNQSLTTDRNNTDSSRYQGTAIAIKQSGRITIKPPKGNEMLIDEFADWHQTYPMTGSANSPGMRIYRMRSSDEQQDIDGCSVLVQPCVSPYKLDDYMIQARTTIDQWCSQHGRTESMNEPANGAATYVGNGNNYLWGFKPSSSGSGGGDLKIGDWKVGDPYGVEIARFDLPKGYIYGSTAPRDNKLSAAGEVSFSPEDATPKMSKEVQIYAMRQGKDGRPAPKQVGSVKADMLKDDANN